ncbi:MAG: HAD family acid phosphatase [Melioribacteraceae bacterium]
MKFIKLFPLLILAACSHSPQLTNLDTAKSLVRNYYESGAYDKDCETAVTQGISEIESNPIPEKAIAIFDVDDTALSNYESSKQIGFGYVPSHWIASMESGEAKAVPQTKRFYDWLISKNIKVIFLTGRNPEAFTPTKKNLLNRGYAKFDTLIVRAEAEKKLPASSWKETVRKQLTQKGYKIIACIGDQWSDLSGEFTGVKIKLPNYIYLID